MTIRHKRSPNGITGSAARNASHKNEGGTGRVEKTEPPRYTIKICTAATNSITKQNARFFKSAVPRRRREVRA